MEENIVKFPSKLKNVCNKIFSEMGSYYFPALLHSPLISDSLPRGIQSQTKHDLSSPWGYFWCPTQTIIGKDSGLLGITLYQKWKCISNLCFQNGGHFSKGEIFFPGTNELMNNSIYMVDIPVLCLPKRYKMGTTQQSMYFPHLSNLPLTHFWITFFFFF